MCKLLFLSGAQRFVDNPAIPFVNFNEMQKWGTRCLVKNDEQMIINVDLSSVLKRKQKQVTFFV